MVEMTKAVLMKHLQMCDFVSFEAALYLDTHKDDKEALSYYKKHRDSAKKYRAEYIEKYGPLTITDNTNEDKWEWVVGQWPWEYSFEA